MAAKQSVGSSRTGGLILLLALFMQENFTPVSAWFFAPPTNMARANGKPIDDTCVGHGQRGDCEFYTCFEQRLPCGDEGYMLRFGVPYCQRFQLTFSAFTQQGKDFINGTSQCLTRALLPYYQQDEVDCHSVAHAAFDAVSSCYAANGFCEVVEDNVAAFADIFQPRHLFQTGALKIWREILEVTYHCEPERVHGFVNYTFGFLSRILRFFASSDDA